MNVKAFEKDGEERKREGGSELNKDTKQIFPENSSDSEVSKHLDVNEKPYVGMAFQSEEAARSFYDAYAKRIGFSTHVGQYNRADPDGPIISWVFSCSREVFRRKNVESCNAMLGIERKSSENWIVSKFVEDHNHPTESPGKVHCIRPRRHFAGGTKNVADSLDSHNDVMISSDGNYTYSNASCGVRHTSVPEMNHTSRNIGPVPQVHFIQPCTRKTLLGRDAQNLLNYFQKMQAASPGFYYAIQLDDDNRMTNIFWADARSRAAYSYFGDAVTFDTMYRPYQFQVPFAPFTGINHHGQMILFGCALLFDESESSFTWLIRTFLSAMNNRPPVSITTDQDRAIKAAVKQVLPETRHCICKWHILREGQERLAHIYLAHPSFYGDIYSCINFSETIEDFESSWLSLMNRYDLHKNEWLRAVYNARQQWSPVYFHDTFFAALSSDQGVGSFFNGFVNQQTTLPMFLKQYERALENSLEREIEADYETISTMLPLKTPSPMEQQAANLYTKKVFAKFQEELVETFVYTADKINGDDKESIFRVAKYERDHKVFIVKLDVSRMIASCSCQMFEYSGIVCRHILKVFSVTNVLTLPSHYILKRWTRNARSDLESDSQDAEVHTVESLTSRFNNLCQEALKYSEEGATASETYTAAMTLLKEGVKKLAAVKVSVAKVKPTTHGSGRLQDDSNKRDSATPAEWTWQDPVLNSFSFNEVRVPDDLNHPTMAHMAISRDGCLADNTVVLTCFKSMTWVIENTNSGSKVAAVNFKLQDYGKTLGETQVQFRLTKVTLEPMLKSMAYINQQLVAPVNKVAVINLKLQDTTTPAGETEVKFQVSRDTLGLMLRSMAYIREQL